MLQTPQTWCRNLLKTSVCGTSFSEIVYRSESRTIFSTGSAEVVVSHGYQNKHLFLMCFESKLPCPASSVTDCSEKCGKGIKRCFFLFLAINDCRGNTLKQEVHNSQQQVIEGLENKGFWLGLKFCRVCCRWSKFAQKERAPYESYIHEAMRQLFHIVLPNLVLFDHNPDKGRAPPSPPTARGGELIKNQ